MALKDAIKKAITDYEVAAKKNRPVYGNPIDCTIRRIEMLDKSNDGRVAVLRILRPINGNDTFMLRQWQLDQLVKFVAPGLPLETVVAILNSNVVTPEQTVLRSMVTLRTAYCEAGVTTFEGADDQEYYFGTSHHAVDFIDCTAVAGATERVISVHKLAKYQTVSADL